jgi:hypothetical protein
VLLSKVRIWISGILFQVGFIRYGSEADIQSYPKNVGCGPNNRPSGPRRPSGDEPFQPAPQFRLGERAHRASGGEEIDQALGFGFCEKRLQALMREGNERGVGRDYTAAPIRCFEAEQATPHGEGGYTVWGKLVPAAASLKAGALPIGLAHRLKLKHDVAHGEIVRWSDVEFDADNETIRMRKAMEAAFAK